MYPGVKRMDYARWKLYCREPMKYGITTNMTVILLFIRRNLIWLLPVIALALIAPMTPAWDINVERYYFRSAHPQRFSNNSFYQFVYDYGLWPALLTFLTGSCLLVLSFTKDKWLNWRKPALTLVLSLVLGSGLIVNGIFKEHWGRPRPNQIEEFGGKLQFRAFYEPHFSRDVFGYCCRSFPCGHCSMGFYFFTLYFLGRRLRYPWLSWFGIAIAFLLGGALSFARMAQGGHFLSDILGTILIMWLTAFLVDRLVYSNLDERST